MSEAGSAHKLRPLRSADLKSYRFTWVLLAELLLILIFPFTAGPGIRAHLFRILGLLLFVVALLAVLGRGRTTRIACALGLPSIVIGLANLAGYSLRWHWVALGLGGVYLLFVAGVFVRAILAEASVTTDTLAGAVSAYLLIGIGFGLIYGCMETVSPGSFRETYDSSRIITPPDLIFFSFTTLTTTGYGDMVPWAGAARSLAVIEEVLGVMYPAVLIARLIGLHASRWRGE